MDEQNSSEPVKKNVWAERLRGRGRMAFGSGARKKNAPAGYRPGHLFASAASQSQLHTRRIVIGNHCYGCTAGAGSSCGGAMG